MVLLGDICICDKIYYLIIWKSNMESTILCRYGNVAEYGTMK